MNCLCCGKPLSPGAERTGWHRACIKRFFGTDTIPEIEINKKALQKLAAGDARKGFAVPGVQKKMSLHLSSDRNDPKLTLVDYPTGYILKPQVEEFEALPEAEHLVMCMAREAGIATVPHALIRGRGTYAFIMKRVDRVTADGITKRLAMEDFCQLDQRLTRDKYRGSYERCAGVIRRYSSRKGLDMTELYLRLVFSFVVGNSDMHLKNFSLLETEEGSGRYQLSPAYDLVPVGVVMPEDNEQFALTMNGRKQKLRRKDFLVFAEECGLPASSAEKMIRKVVSMEDDLIRMCEESLLPEHLKNRFVQLIGERVRVLRGEADKREIRADG